MRPDESALKLLGCAVLVAASLAACGGGGSGDGAAPAVPGAGAPAAPGEPVLPGDPGSPPGAEPGPPAGPDAPPPGPVLPAHATSILFVTQAPVGGDTFMKITSTFGHHLPTVDAVPRGGDLWVAYRDTAGAPELRNLTAEAGFGMSGGVPLENQAGANAIAVREPSVHPSGAKALVSIVVGTGATSRWQVYEVTGLRRGEAVQFTRLNQPAGYNNISPVYASNGHIIFSSDIPRPGPQAQFAHLAPQLDEYEEQPTVSGIWKLDPATGAVTLLHHAPSGAFRPVVDSFGRVVFTNWDHLQRDQQVGDPFYGLFNFRDESAGAVMEPIDGGAGTTLVREVFPEPRFNPAAGFGIHRFNMFLPWMINQDGTGAETLNHVGRHELGIFAEPTILNAGLSATEGASGVNAGLVGQGLKFDSAHFIKENPLVPGDYFAVSAPEFGTHGGGMVYRIKGGPDVAPQAMAISLVTDASSAGNGGPALYRSPLPLRDGGVMASASFVTVAPGAGTPAYEYRLHRLTASGAVLKADGGTYFTTGLRKRLAAGGPLVTLWEWDAVELPPAPVAAAPAPGAHSLEQPELDAFTEAGVQVDAIKTFLRNNQLALIVSRDVTSRDGFDRQQPFNLRVKGTAKQSVRPGSTATLFDIDHLQLFQADQLRGIKNDAARGRRVMAQPMSGAKVGAVQANPAAPGGPAGSVKIAPDGSMAAFVPANRAMTWQLVNAGQGDGVAGTDGVVRERFWLSFQPGEVRVCVNCHGTSDKDQTGKFVPLNRPQALRDLLLHYKSSFAP
ncbi:MAG: hypothetical protein V4757_11020 [Pseudomonadota bacterium]